MSEAGAEAAVGRTYDIAQILNALPPRYPMLLVDRVKDLRIDEEIHAVKAVSFNEAFFQGHFPGQPVVPAIVLIELLAQTGGLAAGAPRPGEAHAPRALRVAAVTTLALLLASSALFIAANAYSPFIYFRF